MCSPDLPAQAFAEEATTVSNAAIRGLKDQIGQRHQELLRSEERRVGKEGRSRWAPLKSLAAADNPPRRQLYEEVAKALNLKPEQVSQVRQIFSKQWRDKAEAGWAVQADNGQWGRK